jgi:hypothetical protein
MGTCKILLFAPCNFYTVFLHLKNNLKNHGQQDCQTIGQI